MLWRAVEKVIPDIRQRTEIEMVHYASLSHKLWSPIPTSLIHDIFLSIVSSVNIWMKLQEG